MTPRLSLKRMEEYCASIDALETAAGYYAGSPPALLRDDARILLSWAKRARPFLEELQRIIDKRGQQVLELHKLLEEFGE